MSSLTSPLSEGMQPLPKTAVPTSEIVARYKRLKRTLGFHHPDRPNVMMSWNELLACYDVSGSDTPLHPSHWPALVSAGFIPGILDVVAKTLELEYLGVSHLSHESTWLANIWD